MHFLKRARARLVSPSPVTSESPTSITSSRECGTTRSLSRQVTVESLSDILLLNIFGSFLDDSPQNWPTLIHICHKWRRIVFASQQALRLRLFCTYGTPVQKSLDFWPKMPVVVQHGGVPKLDPPAPEDEDNMVAALKQSDRVTSISLTLTSSLLDKTSAIERPFSELEDLVLLSQEGMRLTLPNTFRWGPRLRHLHLTRIAFPALLQLLCSSSNLVDLQLHEVFNPWNTSPDALASSLSGLAQLRSLSLHFTPTPGYRTPPPASKERVNLPVLTQLDFRGNTQYLEGLVARIDAPRLGDVEVTFVNEIILELPALSVFIDHTELHKSYRRADILSSEHEISISLTQPGSPMRLRFRLLCEELGYRILSMARICTHFSTFLSDMEDLRICANRPSRSTDRRYTGKWQESISSFPGVKRLHISGDHSKNIVCTLLQPDRRYRTVLPVLQNLRIQEPGPRYSRLREAVVSLMVSRRHSGHLLVVEYEQIRVDELGPLFEHVTIEKLSDDILLKIFRQYLDHTPRLWPRLARVCHRWRHVVFASPVGLNLRLYCTYGTPSPKTVGSWPTLPVVVQYGGLPKLDPPAPEDEANIIAALKLSQRVTSISLTVTSSLLKKLSAIERPFSALEDLVLLSRNDMRMTLPSTFRCGPRLRRLHSTRISFPALLQLLSSSKNLVDLRLHEVLDPSRFPPGALMNALSGMDQLRSLSLHFLPTANLLTPPPPSRKLVFLPALTRLNFQGNSEYLEGLVSRIDTPLLGDIDVAFFDRSNLDLCKLRKLTDRIGMHESHRRADILSSKDAISISFTRPGAHTSLKFQFFAQPLSKQLFFMARICTQFFDLLINVEDLRISAQRPSKHEDALCTERWLEPIKSFTGVKRFHVSGDLSRNIACSLLLPKRPESVLPSLHKLYILQPEPCHATLREAIVSFMVSRRLSGCPIEVEYEQLRHVSEPHRAGPFSQQVTIEKLSNQMLLDIFHHNLDADPLLWSTLASVCQRWRQIILTSPLGLNLRLHCTHETPVLKALNCWPALPIIVKYGGSPKLDPPTPKDDDNIITALKQSSRVSSISLTMTSSLLGKLSSISDPLPELEELALRSPDNMQLTLPSTFRWGPRLRTLHSTRVAIPSFPQLISPCQGLVDLQLHEIPSAGYVPPEAFAKALSEMTCLEALSLHFLSLYPRRSHVCLPPQPSDRVVPLALTRLKYRGTSKYLDTLMARINAPRLEDIDITFSGQPTMDATQLGRFIDRIEMQKSLSQAEVQTSAHAISISLTNASAATSFHLKILCKRLHWQLSCMAQVCDQFSPFLHRVEELAINTTQSPSEEDDADLEQWLDLFRAFGGAKDFRVAGALVTDILCALLPTDRRCPIGTTPLPAMRNLCSERPMEMHGPLWDAVQSFVTSRSLSGCPVDINVPSYQCHLCHASSGQQLGLKRHLVVKHGYRVLCSYCDDFECTPGHHDLFLEHLGSEHPEVMRSDTLVSTSSPLFTRFSFQLESLVYRHSSLSAPDVDAFATVTVLHSPIESDTTDTTDTEYYTDSTLA